MLIFDNELDAVGAAALINQQYTPNDPTDKFTGVYSAYGKWFVHEFEGCDLSELDPDDYVQADAFPDNLRDDYQDLVDWLGGQGDYTAMIGKNWTSHYARPYGEDELESTSGMRCTRAEAARVKALLDDGATEYTVTLTHNPYGPLTTACVVEDGYIKHENCNFKIPLEAFYEFMATT